MFPNFQDCDGDQLLTCEDYMMMHRNGGYNCGKSLAGTPYKRFTFNEDTQLFPQSNLLFF